MVNIMRKFKFLKTAEESDRRLPNLLPHEEAPAYIDESQLEANESYASEAADIAARRKKYVERQTELRKPYGVFHGDAQALLSGNPAARSEIALYHDSLPQWKDNRDARGVLKVHQMKEWLSSPESGYEAVPLPSGSYDFPEFEGLGKDGLTVFVPKGSPGVTRGPKPPTDAVMQARRTVNQESATSMLRSQSGLPFVDELDSTHPLNVFEEHGPEEVLSNIFTRNRRTPKVKSISDEVKANTCICGRSQEDHADRKHEFTPKYIVDESGNISLGKDFRSSQSLLRQSMLPENLSDDPTSSETRYVRTLADRGSSIARIPMVTLGLAGTRIKKYFRRPTGKDQFGDEMTTYVAPNRYESRNVTSREKCPGMRKGQPCFNGSLDPYRSINSTFCGDCIPGAPIYSEDGSRQIGEGLGNGRTRILNQEDCPNCPDCNGEGFRWQNNKSEELAIPCRTCKQTGKDLSAMNPKFGVECGNCHSNNATIKLTDGHVCAKCNGAGTIPKTVTKGPEEFPVEQRELEVTHVDGNPIILEDFDYSDDKVDGWKAHGDPSCPDCHGNDEFQETDAEGNVTPCKNCRIGSHSEKALILPGHHQLVTPTGIKIPNMLFQYAMGKAYPGGAATNPHELMTDFSTVDPVTQLPNTETDAEGRRVVQYGLNESSPNLTTSDLVGVYTSGVNITPDILEELNKRSQKHRASKNAKFCAASAELEDINELIGKRFASLPMNIPGLTVDTPTIKTQPDGTMNAKSLHPRIQEAIPKIQSAIESTGISPDSLRESLKPMFENASRLEHAYDAGESNDEAMSAYENSLRNVIMKSFDQQGAEGSAKMRDTLRKSIQDNGLVMAEPLMKESENAEK